MRKEFKIPVIEIYSINIKDSIMNSADRILETGGVNSGQQVYTYNIDREFQAWRDWI